MASGALAAHPAVAAHPPTTDDRAVVAASRAPTDAVAEALLRRMIAAQREVEFDGTLVYLHGHQLVSLRIARRIAGGVARESLLALSGPVRTLARSERGVTCMLPGAQSFSVPRRQHGHGPLRVGPIDFDRIRRHYLLQTLGESRVAGRDTDVVGIVPLDDYRYGYRYFIDRETGLPLKADLMTEGAEPLEQLMFTEVEFHPRTAGSEPVDASDFGVAVREVAGTATGATRNQTRRSSSGAISEPTPAATTNHVQRPPPVNLSSGNRETPMTSAAGWTLSRMPPGFEVVPVQPASDSGTTAEHLLVSDGIASVSVYVEPSGDAELDGATQMGAITAVGRRIGAHHATVIGEVPERTARMLLDGLMPPR